MCDTPRAQARPVRQEEGRGLMRSPAVRTVVVAARRVRLLRGCTLKGTVA